MLWRSVAGALVLMLAGQGLLGQARPAALEITGTPADFDFLVGDWDLEVESRAPGRPPRFRGRWTAVRSHENRLLVDEFRILDDAGAVRHLSLTYRVFDQRARRWSLRWLNLDNGSWQEAEAAASGGEVHVRQWFGTSGVLRIRYYDITPAGFSWVMDRSTDGGATWDNGYQTIRATRRR